jgi:hypothetical protein
MANILSTIFALFVVLTLSIITTKFLIVPSLVNYQYGLLNSPDFTIGESRVQGVGIFTKRPRSNGERLFVAIDMNENVTRIGSKINHCPSIKTISASGRLANANTILPNTYLSPRADKTTGEWWIMAARDLDVGEELTADYTYTPDFIKKPDPDWKCEL